MHRFEVGSPGIDWFVADLWECESFCLTFFFNFEETFEQFETLLHLKPCLNE